MKKEQKLGYRLLIVLFIGVVVVVFGSIWQGMGQRQAAIRVEPIAGANAQNQQSFKDIALGFWLQWQAADINTALSNDPQPIDFSIEPGESVASIGRRLVALGLVRDNQLFSRFLQYNGLDQSLEAGQYELRANMTMKEIALALQEAKARELTLTIPEGWRAEQIADLLDQEQMMAGDSFLAVVQNGSAVSHPILADLPAGQSLEGYLYPDTYRLPLEVTPEQLITRMLDNLASKLPPNTAQLAANQGLSFHGVMTIASIVERESVVPAERPTIASVYLNRLGPNSPRQRLEADPTVQYAMGYQADTDQWWKTPVSLAEYAEVDSPYNTYLYPGLPPGPIASPGIASILATLEPAETDYFFFVCSKPGCEGGEHTFAVTYEEHLVNVQRYYGN